MLKLRQCNRINAATPRVTSLPLPVSLPSTRKTYFSILNRSTPPIHQKQVSCSAEADSPNETPTSQTTLDYILGQGNYQVLAALFGLLSVSLIFSPSNFSDKIIGLSLLPVSEMIFRSLGALLILPTAISYCMQSAIASNRLESPTYKRLSMTMAFSMAVVCLVKFLSVMKGVAFSNVHLAASTVIQLLPAVAFFKLYGLGLIGEIIPGVMSGINSLFQPDTINSGVYSVLTAVGMVISITSLLFPEQMLSFAFTFQTDNFARLLVQSAGALVFLISIACFTLKDAADRSRLGFTTFKTLNAALSLSSVGRIGTMLFVCERASRVAKAAGADNACMMTTGGGILSLGFFGILALFCGYHAIMAKKE